MSWYDTYLFTWMFSIYVMFWSNEQLQGLYCYHHVKMDPETVQVLVLPVTCAIK